MTKREYAQAICMSPAWDGQGVEWLIAHCSKEELEELFWQIDDAEAEYYEFRVKRCKK